MKNSTNHILFTLLFTLLSFALYSQSPNAIKYQGVVRDAAGEIVKSQAVSFQFKIHDGSHSGPIVYTETHSINTNQYGIVSLEIGKGATSDAFGSINWGSGDKFLEILLDKTGGSSYMTMGGFQLVSVPYALYSNETGSVSDNSISNAKIQNSAVSLDKIDNSGATSGDVLKFDGGSLTWGTVATSSGDITSVVAGDGLTGGATSNDATLNIGAGTGISVSADDISLNETHTNALYVNEGQSNSITSAMLQNGAVTTEKVSGTGATSGQVLSYNGSNVEWSTLATVSGNTLDQAYDEGGAGAGRVINATNGAVHVTGAGGISSDAGILVGMDNSTDDDAITFDYGTTPEQIFWDNSATKFVFTDDIQVNGTIGTSSNVVPYNTLYEFGSAAAPSSGEMTSPGDLHIEFDLEVGSDIYVGGRMMGRVPGISQGRKSGATYVTNTGSMADIVTTTITIPGPGYIMVECNSTFSIAGITTTNYVYHQIDETEGGAVDGTINRISGANSPANTGYIYESISNSRTYYKSTAGTYTFRWEAYGNTSSGTRRFWNPVITATYIPNAHGTVTSFVPESDAAEFSQKTPLTVTDAGAGTTISSPEQTYEVNLKELQDIQAIKDQEDK